MHLAVRLVFVLTALFVSACGDSPTAPTQRTLQVAGTYAGPIVFRVDGRAILSGSAEVQVEQSGSRLTITGVLSVGGRTGTLPRITGTLDSSGRLTNTSGGGVSDGVDATCGRITVTSSVATFNAEHVTVHRDRAHDLLRDLEPLRHTHPWGASDPDHADAARRPALQRCVLAADHLQ